MTAPGLDFNDSHVHLTNYVQEGPDITRFLELMGERVGRAVLFGIPLLVILLVAWSRARERASR